jgi:hypothetical protein
MFTVTRKWSYDPFREGFSMTGSLVEWLTITSRAGSNPVGLNAELGGLTIFATWIALINSTRTRGITVDARPPRPIPIVREVACEEIGALVRPLKGQPLRPQEGAQRLVEDVEILSVRLEIVKEALAHIEFTVFVLMIHDPVHRPMHRSL